MVPLLIAGAGYSKDDENKIVREALADFLYNAAAAFAAGQRVHITRESGTILVEYPIGGYDGA